MKGFFAFFLGFLCFSFHPAYAQEPAVIWQKCLGGPAGDYPWSIRSTTDGGYILAGFTMSGGGDVHGYHGNPDIGDLWVVKMDGTGNVEWQKVLGGDFVETGADILQTPDGGYIIGASSVSRDCMITGNHGGMDYWIVKLTSHGNISWQKPYGGTQNDYCYSIDMTGDGGYVAVGSSLSGDGQVTGSHGGMDFWAIKIDAAGDLLWQKSLGGSADDAARSVKSTRDGGCVIAGETHSNDGDVSGYKGKGDIWVVKLDRQGGLQWQKCLGGAGLDECWSIQVTNDGGFVLGGDSYSNNGDVSGNHVSLGNFADIWVVKLGHDGDLQWQKCYGGSKNELAFDIQPASDGGYLVCGSAESDDGDLTCNAGYEDMWVLKISGSGILQWQKSLGGHEHEEAHSLQSLKDGTCIITGVTCSPDIPGYHSSSFTTCGDYWVVKLSEPLARVPMPVVSISPASGQICANRPVTFTASAQYAGITPQYQWERNGIKVGGNSPTYTAAVLSENDKVTCTVTRAGTCAAYSLQGTAEIVVSFNNKVIQPAISISADNTVYCGCTSITLKATVTGGTNAPGYLWEVNGRETDDHEDSYQTNLLQPGDVVNCLYTDEKGCVAQGSVSSNPVRITAGSDVASSVSIEASKTSICAGSPVTFTAVPVNAGETPSFSWQVNGVHMGTGARVFTTSTLAEGDVVNCTLSPDPAFPCIRNIPVTSNSITMKVSAKTVLSVTINADQDFVCTGQVARFQAHVVAAGTHPVYHWTVNNREVGTNDSIFRSSMLHDGDHVSCLITVDPRYSCSAMISAVSNELLIKVEKQQMPTVVISAPQRAVCAGNPITFHAKAQNAGNLPSYQWVINGILTNNGTDVFTSSSLSDQDSLYCVMQPGKGACSLSTVKSNGIKTMVYGLPAIRIFPGDTTIGIGDQIQLHTVISGMVASYRWDPSSGLEDPLSLDPTTLALQENTVYTLHVESDKGCENTAGAIVNVEKNLFMPNVFSPNGDGVNDVFRIPPGVNLQLKEFSVFDRWGNRVFRTKNRHHGWDGTYKGKPDAMGTYIYFISGSGGKGRVFKRGAVLLIR
jgi:gliding motility-associated-like protein